MVCSDDNPLHAIPTKMVPKSLPLEKSLGLLRNGEATVGQAFAVGGDGECQ
jgi:hypothetical protein